MKKSALILIFLCLIFNLSFNSIFGKENNTPDNRLDNIAFFKNFNDEILVNNLVKVYENNNDLKAAVLKTNEAQKIVKMSFADELPNIGFQGYVGQIFHSSDEVFGSITIPDYTQAHFLLPLTMNYEIDIWGKNYLKTKSKKKQFEMIKQDEKAAYIYISSIFASDYYNLIRTDKLIEYQKELINLQNEVIKSVEKKCKYGTKTANDIDIAKKQLTYLEQDLEKLYEKQDILKNQMNILLSNRAFEDIERNDFNKINKNLYIPNEIKFETLDKRPDRIKSELDLEKTGIDIRVAKRDLLPKFVITGNIGFNMYDVSSPHKFLADIGVVPVWDIFVGGKKIQMLKLKKDEYEIAIQNYEKTILKSIQESNDALYSLKTTAKIDNILNKRLKTDEKLLSDAHIKKDAGTADYLDILIQKERLVESEKSKVMSEMNKIIAAINLYQALGGVDFIENPSNL